LNLDHANRPISYGLSSKERDRMVELHFERAQARIREQQAAEEAAAVVMAALRDRGLVR
jgi:trehalose-6-phosphatase